MLRRWRDRSCEPSARAQGITFEGCRLWPRSFELLNYCVAGGFDMSRPFTADVLRPYYERARLEIANSRVPSVENLIALLMTLSTRKRLSQILGRQRSTTSPGLPDLFLWKRKRDGTPFAGQFIEIKRFVPRTNYCETESKEQREEREFLTDLKVKARIVYLIQS